MQPTPWHRYALVTLLAPAFSACSGSPDVDPPVPVEVSAPTPAQSPPPEDAAASIPKSLQGRWGLTLADCDVTRSDAKGAVTIGMDRLRFYESTGSLSAVTSRRPDHLDATFAFTGEGQEWTRTERFSLEPDGRLSRMSEGEGSLPGPLLYERCSAP